VTAAPDRPGGPEQTPPAPPEGTADTVASVEPDWVVPREGSGFVRHVLVVSGGSVAAQLLGIVATPLISRLFTPEAYGIATIFGSVVGIFGVVCCLRYDSAILLPKSDREAAQLLGVCLASGLALGLLVAALAWVGGEALWGRLGAPELAAQPDLLLTALTLTALGTPLVWWNQRFRYFGRVSVARIVSNGASTLASIAAGVVGWTSGAALASARTYSGILGLALVFVVAGWKTDLAYVRKVLRPHLMVEVARRFIDFPRLNLPASLLDAVARESPAMLLGSLYGTTDAGLYAMSSRLLRLPSEFISTAIRDVLYERVASAHANKEPLGPIVEAACTRLIALGIWPMLAIGLSGPQAFGVFFGPQWEPAGLYTLILAPAILAMFIASPITLLFTVLEAHRFFAISQVALTLCYTMPFVVAAQLQLPATQALMLYVAICGTANLLRLHGLLRLVQANSMALVRHALLHLLFALPSLVAYGVAHWLLHWPLVACLAVLTATGGLYLALAVRQDPGLTEVLDKFRRRLPAFLQKR